MGRVWGLHQAKVRCKQLSLFSFEKVFLYLLDNIWKGGITLMSDEDKKQTFSDMRDWELECPHCGAVIPGWYVSLHQKCRECKEYIKPKYPLAEW